MLLIKEARKRLQREMTLPQSHKEESASHPDGHKQASWSSLHSLIQRIVHSEADSVPGSRDEANQQSWLLVFPELIDNVCSR